jgi:RND family efflux transporter MFP subunit
LQTGAILETGTALFRIDATDYELAIAEAKATIAAKKAQLAELDQRETSTRHSLEIEQSRLRVAEREIQRQRTLHERGTVPQATVDRQEREYLQQRQTVQELENTLALLPAERDRLEAELAREQTRLRRAERDLARTTITAPFDLRVAATDAETGQVVQAGETLMEGDAVEASEVEAEVPIERFRALLDPARRPVIGSVARLRELLPAMGLTAEVRLRTGGEPVIWDARIDRISEAIDVETRTLGAVAVVERPYERARPPEQPPLVKGMYVEVRLCGPTRPPAVLVPRAALHGNRVYTVGPKNRLRIREVEVADRHGGFAVIGSGLDAGDQVVLTDLVPAITGMKLAPQSDESAARQLRADARGEEACP